MELEEDSTTFNTPFGRYRWKRRPFGICSAPEVFQRRIHQPFEGLKGVEVVGDDFVVVGFGDTLEGAVKDHDLNLEAFRGIKLNSSEVQLRKQEVPFIGHVATDKSLRADPTKIHAITQMPPPTGVQRLLGMVQYLAKFFPHFCDINKSLRELTHKEIEWVWDQPQENTFRKLREAISTTSVLRYRGRSHNTMRCVPIRTGGCSDATLGLCNLWLMHPGA